VSFGIANFPAHFAHCERTANVPFGPASWHRADVYQPLGSMGPVPVIVFWYGGAWTEGNKDEYRFVGTALAGLGFVAVLPDYRVYPEVKFPAFLDDAAAAVAWVQSHAAQFGGDPHRIVLMGHSAGAHMAAMLAINHEYLNRAGVDTHDIVGLIDVSSDAPPTLLIQGASDRLVRVSNTRRLADALRQKHVPVRVVVYPHRGHGDTVAALSWAARFRSPTLDDIDRFMHE
jgi:acetyl esterase/lipase